MKSAIALSALSCLLSHAVSAAVVEVTPSGFAVAQTVTTTATAKKLYEALLRQVGAWWNPEHTYSGNAHNLSIANKVGGCFCERLEHGGEVEHARVILLIPDSQLRMSGAFGPLQSSGLAGTLSFKISESTAGTQVEMTYNVGGYMHGGFDSIAPIVDQVLGGQLKRLKAFVETGSPQ